MKNKMEMQIQLVRNGEVARTIDVATKDSLKVWLHLFFLEDEAPALVLDDAASSEPLRPREKRALKKAAPKKAPSKAKKAAPKKAKKRKSPGLTQVKLYQHLLGKPPQTVSELCGDLGVSPKVNMSVMASRGARLGYLRKTKDGEGGLMRYALLRKGEKRLAQLLREEGA